MYFPISPHTHTHTKYGLVQIAGCFGAAEWVN